MAEGIESAQEAIEHAHHGPEHTVEPNARRVAVLVALLAVALALTEVGSNSAQNAYLTHHIQAADDWAFYQAKTIRSNLYALQADTLASLPVAAESPVRQRIDDWRMQTKRLDDDEKTQGRKQLMDKAHASEAARDHAFHRYHLFEGAVGAIQIGIVLASVSIVTRVRLLAFAAAALGALASLFALVVAFDAF